MKNPTNLLVVLLSVIHHLGSLLRLFLELFLRLLDLLFLLGYPMIQLEGLPLEGPWRNLLLVVHLVDVLLR